jgi:hypothetical protein
MILDVVNWDNFRVFFGLYFLFQIYRLALYFFRKPANLKGNFQVRRVCLGWQRGGDSALCCAHQPAVQEIDETHAYPVSASSTPPVGRVGGC